MVIKETIVSNGYFVTTYGHVYSYKSKKFLKIKKDKNGYARVNLSIYGKCETFLIAHLVMLFYNKEYKYIGDGVIKYRDKNRHNVHYTNLYLLKN